MRLLAVEFRRLRLRRLTKATVAILGLVIVAIGTVNFFTHADSLPDMTEANRMAAEQEAECVSMYANDPTVTEAEASGYCVTDPAWFVLDERFHLQSILAGTGTESWSAVSAMSAERYPFQNTENGPTYEGPSTGFQGVIPGFGTILAAVSVLVGASLIGAEWRSGTIESQLVWEPHRKRLLGAKFAAAGIGMGVLAMAALLLTTTALLPAAFFRGSTSNTGGDFWLAWAATIGRAGLLAGAMAIIGASIASIGRNTVAGVVAIFGSALGVVVVGQQFFPQLAAKELFTNVSAFLRHGDVGQILIERMPDGGTSWSTVVAHGWVTAGSVVLVAATVVALAASAVFARRDVA